MLMPLATLALINLLQAGTAGGGGHVLHRLLFVTDV
jgi:hypothetical protein